MKILLAPDSFKGSLKSPAVARAMAEGARQALPEAELVELPVGDGGEGTLEALVTATGGEYQVKTVIGPVGEPVEARLGLLGDGETVFVEMAEASGLSRVAEEERDPLLATTYGTGQLLRAAFATERPRIVVGLGGSATTDGGAGMLQALGLRLLDSLGQHLPQGGAALLDLHRIERGSFELPSGREIVLACDVTNPLTGPQGAAAVYGPQKGASPQDIRLLDDALGNLANVAAEAAGKDWRTAPGAGAAGGLGFAFLAFLSARMERGVELVLDCVGFDRHLQGAELVVTGEGKIDRQTTAFGKTLTGIGARASRAGVPVLALGGSLGSDIGDYRAAGISGIASIVPGPMSLERAMSGAGPLVSDAARRLIEVFQAGRNR
ncbi:MAG: glycerate kinase [Armatimonadota bacterium]